MIGAPLLAAALAAHAAPAASAAARASCWRQGAAAGLAYYAADVGDPAENLLIAYEPLRFSRARDLGVVVANGTFFEGKAAPLGDVLDSSGREFHPAPRLIRDGGRVVDLGRRWALGRRRGETTLAVVRSDEARETMDLYLGGGAILLRGGEDRTAENVPAGEAPGESFPPDILDRRAPRAAAGLAGDGEGQRLLIVGVPAPGARPAELAALMKQLGARDAVMFDGGGAFGFSAGAPGGPKDLEAYPSNRGEDLNPTHFGARVCGPALDGAAPK